MFEGFDGNGLGRMHSLEVTEITEQGAFVDAAEYGQLFVPRSQLPDGLLTGGQLHVFLYVDGQRVLATAKRPYLQLGQVGTLKTNSVENGTAYMDLGIPKELVVPVSEQRFGFEPGESSIVYIAMDEQGRLFGSQRFNRYIEEKAPPGFYRRNDRVKVVPLSRTPMGFKVIVDDCYYGLIYKEEQKGPISMGKRYEGYIVQARADGRIDVSLQEQGREGIEHYAQQILRALDKAGGRLGLSDSSTPEEIEHHFLMSKGKFKKALGHLYKKRLIEMGDDGIVITAKGADTVRHKTPEGGGST